MRVLLSVYDKTGLEDFARGLAELGHELIASGGTAAALDAAGIPHATVESVTGAPELLGGRVKTLHPRLHAGILADRSTPDHLADLDRARHRAHRAGGLQPVPVPGQPLHRADRRGRTRPWCGPRPRTGPTWARSSTRTPTRRSSTSCASDGALSDGLRRRLAAAAFAHTAAYDAAIANWFAAAAGDDLPSTIHLSLEKGPDPPLRREPAPAGSPLPRTGRHSWWDDVVQHGGLALSYLNLYDADAAWRLAHQLADLGPTAAVVVKHANPCGAAVADDLLTAYDRAFECDPMSAFGGIVALTAPVTEAVAARWSATPGPTC